MPIIYFMDGLCIQWYCTTSENKLYHTYNIGRMLSAMSYI